MNSHEALSTEAADWSPQDDQLETLLVHLVGRLEQQMLTLERTDQVKRMIRTIEASLGMLVTIIDTGIENYDLHFFSHELPSVWRLRERSKVVLSTLDRESWTGIFGLHPKAKSTTLTMYRSLGKNFAQMFRDLIARFGEEFQSPQRRESFRESCVVFLDDFLQRW